MMDSFEFNKIAGAILFTILIALGLRLVAELVYAPVHPETPGFAIAVPETGTSVAAGDTGGPVVPFAQLLHNANVEKGEAQSKKCAACHTFEKGGANKIGPNLYNIVGETVAAAELGFAFSPAMEEKGKEIGKWSFDTLNEFIAAPAKFVPGTKMSFAGLKKDGDRADLIAYLRTLNDNPPPLPDVPAEGAAPAQEDAAPASGSEPAAAEKPAENAAPAAPAATETAPTQAEQPAAPEAAPATGEQPAAPAATETAPTQSEQPSAPAGTAPAEPKTETQGGLHLDAPAEPKTETQGGLHLDAPVEKSAAVFDAGDVLIVPASGDGTAAAPAAAESVEVIALMAAADPVKGQAQAKKCAACHSFEKGGANKIGPNLYGIVGEEIAAPSRNYAFSKPMQAKAEEWGTWSYGHLLAYLEKPAAAVKGTKMIFAGIKKDTDRADLVAYLRSLADEPVPLPQ